MEGFVLMNVEKKGTCVQFTHQIQVLINLFKSDTWRQRQGKITNKHIKYKIDCLKLKNKTEPAILNH